MVHLDIDLILVLQSFPTLPNNILLNKLQFDSMNNDKSQLHDRLAYWLFQQMDVPSPRSVHARLLINGEFNGLFALTEQIDKRFVKQNFDDDDGNLYKEIWPLRFTGNLFSDQEYIAALKTNENDNPDVSFFRDFGQQIASSNLNTGKEIVEQYMDIEEIISYAAVDRTIRHDDGPFHWYCFDGCASHNFYWYEESNEQKLHLIPWDMDNAFENISVKPESLKLSRSIKMIKSDLFVNPILRKI